MNQYQVLLEQAAKHHPFDKNFCGVICVALCLNCSFSFAHSLLKNKGRKDATGIAFFHILDVIRENGKIVKEVTNLFESLKIKTIRELQKRNLKDFYIILTKTHVCVYSEGQLLDWSNNRCHRITGAYRLEN